MKKIAVALLFLLITACGKNTTPETPVATSPATKNIGVRYEDFANNFNSRKTEFIIADNLDFKIKPNSDTAELTYEFNKTTMMNIEIDKTSHKIQHIYLLKSVGGNDNTEKLKSLLDAPVISSIATQVINPTIPKEQIGKLVLDLFGNASEHQNTEKSTVINGVTYIAKFDTEFKSYVYEIKP